MNYVIVLLVLWLCFMSSCAHKENAEDGFNIILITIDTLRADHLSCYGYERNTSPHIDALAEGGIRFKNAVAPSSWTAPSMVSLFTSVYPISHGVIHGLGYRENETIHVQEVFSDELTTLAEILQAHGYTTFGVASNLHLSGKFGFARGFDYFKCLPWVPAPDVNKEIFSWDDEIKKSQKYFLWAHYFDPHAPYLPHKPWIEHYTSEPSTQQYSFFNQSMAEIMRRLPSFKGDPQALMVVYDSEINFVDFSVGELLHKLGPDKNALIIITSDHGEEFLEHDQFGHGKNLFQETIHIPLIVKLPHAAVTKTVEQYCNLIDVMPSILCLLNADHPKQVVGRNLLEKDGLFSRLKNVFPGRDPSQEYNFSELETHRKLKTIIASEWKYIYNYKDRTEQLYNLRADPSESNNLAPEEEKRRNLLRKNLFAWTNTAKRYPPQSKSFELSEEDRKKLKALGYLGVDEIGDDNQESINNNEIHNY